MQSDATGHAGLREAARRSQLGRFNDRLADIVVRDAEEETQFATLALMVFKFAWPVALMTAAYALHEVPGFQQWSVKRIGGALAASIAAGLFAAKAWAVMRGETMPGDGEPDPYGPAQEEVGFTSIRLRRGRRHTGGTTDAL